MTSTMGIVSPGSSTKAFSRQCTLDAAPSFTRNCAGALRVLIARRLALRVLDPEQLPRLDRDIIQRRRDGPRHAQPPKPAEVLVDGTLGMPSARAIARWLSRWSYWRST
ncbi:hypothetical protein [Gemmatimonas sp.]|uniref:hypothetical protein n=1 Tax=Gemmatimonas sp. TaxID=1962908 RepID=UPI0035629E40